VWEQPINTRVHKNKWNETAVKSRQSLSTSDDRVDSASLFRIKPDKLSGNSKPLKEPTIFAF